VRADVSELLRRARIVPVAGREKTLSHRSLIAFAAWWSLGHASVMAIQTLQAWNRGIHREYTDVVLAGIVGGALLAVTPTARDAAAHREAAAAVAL